MKPTADPRRMTRRVLVEKRTRGRVPGGNGEEVDTWAPAWRDSDNRPIYLYAEKLEGRALERFAAAQTVATVTAAFKFAWAPANQIDPATHRLVYDGRTLDIAGAVEVGERQGVHVWSEAVARAPEGIGGPA